MFAHKTWYSLPAGNQEYPGSQDFSMWVLGLTSPESWQVIGVKVWLGEHVYEHGGRAEEEGASWGKREKKAKLQRWNWRQPQLSTHPTHPVQGCRAAAQKQAQRMCCSSAHTDIHLHKTQRHMYMYDADTATALLFPKLYLRNNLETQLSQQQSWTWKRRAGVQMGKHSRHSKPRHHYASQRKPCGDMKNPLILGEGWHTPKHSWKGRFQLPKCLCNWVQQQICLSHRGKEEHEQGPDRWDKGRSRATRPRTAP